MKVVLAGNTITPVFQWLFAERATRCTNVIATNKFRCITISWQANMTILTALRIILRWSKINIRAATKKDHLFEETLAGQEVLFALPVVIITHQACIMQYLQQAVFVYSNLDISGIKHKAVITHGNGLISV